jgi:hypothetical protein
MNDKLYSSVESIVNEDGNTQLGVCLTVLPSDLTAAAPLRATLQPWLWAITSWVVVGRPSNGAWKIVQATETHFADKGGHWQGLIDATTKQILAAVPVMVAKGRKTLAGDDPLNISLTNDISDTPAIHMYNALLMSIAASPYPIPQNLKLSFFLSLPTDASLVEYAALPIFTCNGLTYSPSAPSGTTNQPWETTVSPTGGVGAPMDMHSDFFSLPDAHSSIPKSLWLEFPSQDTPLVSNWPAHLLEMLGPYLNVARVMASPEGKEIPPSPPLLSPPPPPLKWQEMRASFRKAIYDLFLIEGSYVYDTNTWANMLVQALPTGFTQTPVLNPADASVRSNDIEIADLRALLTGITSGSAPLRLLVGISKGSIPVTILPADIPVTIPTDLRSADKAAGLLRLLETRLAGRSSRAIAVAVSNAVNSATGAIKMSDLAAALFAPGGLISNRLSTSSSEWLASFPLTVSNIQVKVRGDLQEKAYGTRELTRTGPSGSAIPNPVLTTEAAPLVIPVMPLKAATDAIDPLHGMRGVGVLMRRKAKPGEAAQDWSCLNIAAPCLASPGTDGSCIPDQNSPLFVPIRPNYSYDLLTAFMPYSNSSFATDDFLHRYLGPNQLAHTAATVTDTIIASVLNYAPYEGTDASFAGVPELQAGAVYEIAPFAVTNSGALPVALRDGYPAKYKPIAANAPLPGIAAGHPTSTKFEQTYYRTVPVGGLHVLSANASDDSIPILPSIPATVAARAGEVILPQDGGLSLPGADSAPALRAPLLMLAPTQSMREPGPFNPGVALSRSTLAKNKWTIKLKLPTVEPLTWDRTVGYTYSRATPANDQLRADILDTALSRLARQQPADITDPLIDSINFALYRWKTSAAGASWESVGLTIAGFSRSSLRYPNGTTAKQMVETLPIEILVAAGDGSSPNGTIELFNNALTPPVKQTLTTNLGQGEVYRLEAILKLNPSVKTIMVGYPDTLTAYELLIEIASATLPDVQMLNTNLSAKSLPAANIPDQQVQVRLPAQPANFWSSLAWSNIIRVVVLRQSWLWTGRTQPTLRSLPLTDNNLDHDLVAAKYPVGDSDAIAMWETIEFADRPVTDHVELGSKFRGGQFGYDQDLSLDLRATYLRFAPRVFSRYEGMFVGTPDNANWHIVSTVGDSKGRDLWTSCLVRSRVRTLSLPRLKALIPLTESAFTPGAPGVMAIFDGPACGQAGFAENMMVSIAKAVNPKDGTELSQAGPDNVMSGETVVSPPLIPKLIAIGPIGHTLDPDVPGAKFISHSYIVRPANPADSEQPPSQDFSWWFADLQFTLGLDPGCSVFPGIVSDSSVGSWIQFLPGFHDASQKALLVKGWKFNWNAGQIKIYDGKGAVVLRGTTAERHVRHYVLVTRRVLDLSGIAREAYFGIAQYNGGIWQMLSGSPPNTAADQLRLRFLDIRSGEAGGNPNSPDPPSTQVEFWRRATSEGLSGDKADDYRSSPIELGAVILPRGYTQ